MASSELVLHRGARLVERSELETVHAPPPTATWFPLSHASVLDRVSSTLAEAGFQIQGTRLALSADNARFFASLDLTAPIAAGVGLCVGARNSTDKSFPISFCAGHRVFVCDNLAFRSEITVARKHTRFGETRFSEAICRAVGSLHQFQETEATRIKMFQETILPEEWASHLLLKAYERRLVSHYSLPAVLKEWREPSFEEFRPRTLWSLMNAFTSALRERQKTNPQEFASVTIRLQDLLSKEPVGHNASEMLHATPA